MIWEMPFPKPSFQLNVKFENILYMPKLLRQMQTYNRKHTNENYMLHSKKCSYELKLYISHFGLDWHQDP